MLVLLLVVVLMVVLMVVLATYFDAVPGAICPDAPAVAGKFHPSSPATFERNTRQYDTRAASLAP